MSKTMDLVVRERMTETIIRKNDVADNVEWIHNLEDEIDQLRAEVDKKDRLLREIYRFLDSLEIEPDEDSCMGMAFVTSRVSEDEYYSLKNKIDGGGR